MPKSAAPIDAIDRRILRLLQADAKITNAELARRVTSPGGTTAAGLAVMDAGDEFTRIVGEVLRAARDRGVELAAAARA